MDEPVKSKEQSIALVRSTKPNERGLFRVHRVTLAPRHWYSWLLKLVGRNPNEETTYEPNH